MEFWLAKPGSVDTSYPRNVVVFATVSFFACENEDTSKALLQHLYGIHIHEVIWKQVPALKKRSIGNLDGIYMYLHQEPDSFSVADWHSHAFGIALSDCLLVIMSGHPI
jgi:hypothetical protein